MPKASQLFDEWFTDYTGASIEEKKQRLINVLYAQELKKAFGKTLKTITILTPKEMR